MRARVVSRLLRERSGEGEGKRLALGGMMRARRADGTLVRRARRSSVAMDSRELAEDDEVMRLEVHRAALRPDAQTPCAPGHARPQAQSAGRVRGVVQLRVDEGLEKAKLHGRRQSKDDLPA